MEDQDKLQPSATLSQEPRKIEINTEYGVFDCLFNRKTDGQKTTDQVVVGFVSPVGVRLFYDKWMHLKSLLVKLLKEKTGQTYFFQRYDDQHIFAEQTYPNELSSKSAISHTTGRTLSIKVSEDVKRLKNFIQSNDISATAIAVVAELMNTKTEG